jgi:hypothetical protein
LVYSISHRVQCQLRSRYRMELMVVEPWLLASLERIVMISAKKRGFWRIYRSCNDHWIHLINRHHIHSV